MSHLDSLTVNDPPAYKLVKRWSDSEAKDYWELRKWQPYDENHSCYGCYDSFRRHRRTCRGNGPRWVSVNSGTLAWAKRTAKHYKIEMPK